MTGQTTRAAIWFGSKISELMPEKHAALSVLRLDFRESGATRRSSSRIERGPAFQISGRAQYRAHNNTFRARPVVERKFAHLPDHFALFKRIVLKIYCPVICKVFVNLSGRSLGRGPPISVEFRLERNIRWLLYNYF